MSVTDSPIGFLFVHVPKRASYYKPLDDFMFVNYLPMGVFALCDLLNKNGIVSRIKHAGLETILDENFSIANWVKEQNIKVVGISLHWHYQSFDVIDVAEKIKRASPETVILLGGFTASRFPREILENFAAVDAIIIGDAEGSIVPFTQAVLRGERDFSAIANCAWRNGDEIVENAISFTAQPADLQELDFANLSLLDHYEQYRDYFRLPMFWMNNADMKENMKRKIGAEKLFPLAVGRGCLVNCTFCGGSHAAHKRLFNREQPIFRTVDSVVDTMQKALSYGYTGFIVCFDPDPQDDAYYIELMAEVRRRGIYCGFSFETWGLPTPAFVDAFAQTFDLKHSYIALSPETGVEEIRRKNKGIYYTNQQLFEAMDYLQAKNVPTLIYLTMGIPGETFAHVQQTTQFAKQLRRRYRKILQGLFCLQVQIEPTSAIFESPADYDITSSRASFMDFYRSHRELTTSPYDYPGYALNSISPEQREFAETLQRERCENFCFIAPKLLGRLDARFLGSFICKQSHANWKRKGFGQPAAERKTFA
jgi:radical SAM superfamily enzyme YgiQ (UPF0313 family)